MFHGFSPRGAVSHGAAERPSGGLIPFPLISLPLLVGLFFGSAFGLFSSLTSDFFAVLPGLSTDFSTASFPAALWCSGRFILAALLLATSFLGFAALPALSALRGFLLGCGVAAAFQSEGFHGLLTAFFSFGLPALLSLPAFLLAASDAAACSRQLLRCFSRGENRPLDLPGDFPRHLLAVLALCLAESVYIAFLLPGVIACF